MFKFMKTDGTRQDILPTDTLQFKGITKINRGCFRWILLLLIFWPAVFLFFFVGTEVGVINLNGNEFKVSKEEYNRIQTWWCNQP